MKGAAKKLQWFGRQLWIRRTWIGLLFLRGTAAEGNKQHNDEKKNELLFYLHNLKPPLFLKNNFITSLVTLLSFWVYLKQPVVLLPSILYQFFPFVDCKPGKIFFQILPFKNSDFLQNTTHYKRSGGTKIPVLPHILLSHIFPDTVALLYFLSNALSDTPYAAGQGTFLLFSDRLMVSAFPAAPYSMPY